MALTPLLLIATLMVICSALEIEELFDIQDYTFQPNNIGGFPLKHIRQKRDASPDSWVYIIDVEVNVSDQTVIQDIKSELNSLSFPVQLENEINVTQINITTVCSPNGTGYQCKCEDQLAWSYNTCLTYTSCGNDYNNYSCGCINGLPPDGESCGYIQPPTPPPQPPSPTPTPTLNQTFDYIIDIEVNVSDISVVNQLRSLLNRVQFPYVISNTIEIDSANLTTVCSPNGTGYQCKCEDQLAWSYNTCLTYTSCGNDYNNYSCGCINGLPPDGESCGYIQPPTPPPQPPSPTPTPTLNQTFDYIIDIEVNVSDISVVNQLRSLLNRVQFPYVISNTIEIDSANLTTVCSPNGTGYQCKCEDQLAWSYNTCLTYTSCGNDYNNYSCGCINGLPPDGESCGYIQPPTPPPQPPSPTPTPTLNQTFDYIIDIEVNVSDISVVNQLRSLLNRVQFPYVISNTIEIDSANLTTVCSPNGTGYQCKCEDQLAWSYNTCLTYTSCGNDYNNYSCGCINGLPPDGESCGYIQPPTPPPQPPSPTPTPTLNQTFDYIIDIEVNVSDISVVNQLRSLLNRVQFPYVISNTIEIDSANLTTVCSPNGTGYQCKCEDQLAWSYNTCLTYTSCGNDYNNYSCGCINGLPPDGESCGYIQPPTPPPQPPSPTPTPTLNQTFDYIIDIEVNVSDISVVNQLRSLLNRVQFPYVISNTIEIDSANLTTVCSPNGTGYQCKCEDQLAWSYNTCLTYTSCGNDYNNYSCGCINGLPPDGESCGYIQPPTPPPQPPSPTPTPTLNQTFDYIIDIEVNVSDISVVNQLRSLLNRVQFPYVISNTIEIDSANLTTVCSPNGTGYQCKCEDQLAWSYNTCLTYTSCGNDYNNYSCGCINGLPPDGESCGYIQPPTPPPQPPSPTPTPTLNQTFDYIIDIEVNVSDISVVNQLRSLLNRVQFPYVISNTIEIDSANLTTVCSPNGTGYQCKCEDQLAWSYNTCLTYTSCGNDYNNYSCGCINGLPPDGESCGYIQPPTPPPQPPSPTPTPTLSQTFNYFIAIEVNVSDISVLNQLRSLLNYVQFPYMISNTIEIDSANLTTVCSPNGTGYQCKCEDQLAWSYNTCLTYTSCGNDYNNYSCGCINGLPPDGESCGYIQPPTPPPQPPSPTPTPTLNQTFDYIIDIEVNVSDISVVNQLRSLLNRVQFPYVISNTIEIDSANLTTVCSPNGTGYQCKCEDQLAWSYNTCLTYTSCGNDYNNYSCGCINGLPPDGESCGYIQPPTPPPQPPSPTPTPTLSQTFNYFIAIEVNVSDISVLNQLRSLLNYVQFPYMISNTIEIDSANLTTVCSPNGTGYQCKCEDQLAWSYNTCLTYTSCGNDYNNYSCGCINGLPPDGESCGYIQPPTPPPQPPSPTPTPTLSQTFNYFIAIEVNVSDISVLNQLRSLLNYVQFPYMISNTIEIDSANLTTVCSPNGTGYQCKCEDQLAWSYNTCLTYTSCGNDYNNYSCGCINGLPPDGESCGYIQPPTPPPQPPSPTPTPSK
ncbi:uncharacterized protein LOC114911280 [Scleropages formosus]|uniref:uncharacterized protein LOC114911280 n=1 Tax=Scleropages formosus TaxID=113540 RepID=UPI0010FA9DBD|nr:uncharacterized protein LOC114911280 [Scleropages formosus]